MFIIAFEGIDASGKETQQALLAKALSRNFIVVEESFPRYHTKIGQLISEYLRGDLKLTKEAVRLLYEADRYNYLNTIRALEEHGCEFLLLDRFTMSGLAYGDATGVDIQWLRQVQNKLPKPDLTIFLDITPGESMLRKGGGGDINEQNFNLLQEVRRVYLELCKSEERVVVIPAMCSVSKVHQKIVEVVETTFNITI